MSAPAIRTEGCRSVTGTPSAASTSTSRSPRARSSATSARTAPGKTTTIRLLLGLARPTAGGPRSSASTASAETVEAHRRLAYVPGEARPVAVADRRGDAASARPGPGRVDTAYRDELIERFDLDPSKKVRAYSKGNRQKVLLIAALMTRADLLVLDEPTSGLDPLMEQAFRHCVHEARDAGQTVFLSSHILSEVEALCDRVGILREGRLVEMGTLAEMRHLSALTVEATFDGAPPDLTGVPGREARRGQRPPRASGGPGPDRAAHRGAGRRRGARAAQPGAVAGGAVPGPLRPGGAAPVADRRPVRPSPEPGDDRLAGRGSAARASRPAGRHPGSSSPGRCAPRPSGPAPCGDWCSAATWPSRRSPTPRPTRPQAARDSWRAPSAPTSASTR